MFDGGSMAVDTLWTTYREEKDPAVRERLLMVIWLEKGRTTYEVADLLDCPQSKVGYWKGRFEKEGVVGLRTRSRSGRPAKLSRSDTGRIKGKLMSVDYWQTKWVSDLIYQETGVVYSERHVVRLLHAWGFEKIRPRKAHIQADEKEQREFSKKPGNYWTRSPRAGM
jgi:transposase